MKRLFSLFLLSCMSCFIATPSFADDNQSVASSNVSTRAEQIEQQLSKMQHEISNLQSELKAARKEQAKHSHYLSKKKLQSKESLSAEAVTTTESNLSGDKVLGAGVNYIPADVDVPGRSLVSTGPYIGIPLVYSGTNLIINSPYVNEDVSLLNLRKNIRNRLRDLGKPVIDDHAHLLLSGIVEGQMTYERLAAGSSFSDIDVTSASLDGYLLGPDSWTSALFEFSYDARTGTSEGVFNNNARSQNARLYVNKAFIILGDFEKSPIYATLGQMYVPFGTYSTNMVSSPVTRLLARTKARALLLGYQQQTKNAFYAAGYVFKGDSYVGTDNRINNGGINLGYRYNLGVVSGDIGGGIIANIADSMGLQNPGNIAPMFSGFGGVAGVAGNEQLVHRVPAMNLRGLFSLANHVALLAEYVGATTQFSKADLTFNTHGAKPQALNAEAVYTFTAFDKPTSLAAGYGRTKDGLAVGLPWQRVSLVLNTSWWKDTLQSLELRHDINYAASNTATGSTVTPLINGVGRSDNGVTGQFDIYF